MHPDSPAAFPNGRSRQRLLLVDDDPLILECLAALLRTDCFEVSTALGGLLAMETFCRAIIDDAPFDAVIADLGMPVLDGRDVVQRVRWISPGTTTVLLAGWGDRPEADDDTSQWADRVVAKPVRIEELRQALRMY